MNLELVVQLDQLLISILARRIPHLTADLASGKYRGVLGELWFLLTRAPGGQGACRARQRWTWKGIPSNLGNRVQQGLYGRHDLMTGRVK